MEKQGYREILEFLSDKGVPPLMSQRQAASELGVSYDSVRRLIKSNRIKLVGTMVPIGALARLMCG